MSDLSKRCLTCKHWEGDKKKVRKEIEQYGLAKMMDIRDGWSSTGDCAERYHWLEIETNEYGCVTTVDIPASFGCPLHEPEDKQ